MASPEMSEKHTFSILIGGLQPGVASNISPFLARPLVALISRSQPVAALARRFL